LDCRRRFSISGKPPARAFASLTVAISLQQLTQLVGQQMYRDQPGEVEVRAFVATVDEPIPHTWRFERDQE
jgi:hypothetical protein